VPPVIKEEQCILCGICVDICPEDVFYGSEKAKVPWVTYPDECYHCAACVIDCPTDAIWLYIPLPMRPWFVDRESLGKPDRAADRTHPTDGLPRGS
jgi:adenylylsulfate reductase subunit B